MITLAVKEYCQECTEFEPVTTKAPHINGTCATIVYCENRDKCARIERLLHGTKED